MNSSAFLFINYWTRSNLLLNAHWLVWKILVLILSVYPMQKVYFLKRYHQKSMVKNVWKENSIRMSFLFCLLKLQLTLKQIPAQMNKYLIHNQIYRSVLPQSFTLHLVRKFVMLEWNGGRWKISKILRLGYMKNVIKRS